MSGTNPKGKPLEPRHVQQLLPSLPQLVDLVLSGHVRLGPCSRSESMAETFCMLLLRGLHSDSLTWKWKTNESHLFVEENRLTGVHATFTSETSEVGGPSRPGRSVWTLSKHHPAESSRRESIRVCIKTGKLPSSIPWKKENRPVCPLSSVHRPKQLSAVRLKKMWPPGNQQVLVYMSHYFTY